MHGTHPSSWPLLTYHQPRRERGKGGGEGRGREGRGKGGKRGREEGMGELDEGRLPDRQTDRQSGTCTYRILSNCSALKN